MMKQQILWWLFFVNKGKVCAILPTTKITILVNVTIAPIADYLNHITSMFGKIGIQDPVLEEV
jgi:hypothetical protein